MIVSHPLLFNTIVVLFIAFTSGWLVFVINSSRVIKLNGKMERLEKEKEQAHQKIRQLEAQLEERYTHAGRGTVISLSPPVKVNKAR